MMFYSESGAIFQQASRAGVCKGTFEIVSEDDLWSGILSNSIRSLSPECFKAFWMMTIYSDTLHWSDITRIFDLVTDVDLITEFDFYLIARDVYRTIATGAACQ